MSDEHFLARWSRLKRQDTARPDRPAEEPKREEPSGEPSASAAPQPPSEAPDLPPIETIGPDTDVRAFLTRGVPAELTRAALRTAWAADPAIRDFVGLSENAWDFNAPETIPGFAGPLPAADSARLARLFDRAATADSEALGEGPSQADAGPVSDARLSAAESEVAATATEAGGARAERDATPEGDAGDESVPQRLAATDVADATGGAVEDTPDSGAPRARRAHGGAVPQ